MPGVSPPTSAVIENTLARRAFWSGICGAITLLVTGYLAAWVSPDQLSSASRQTGIDAAYLAPFTALALCGTVMFGVELALRLRIASPIRTQSDKLSERHWVAFAVECMLVYLLGIAVLALLTCLYWGIQEYGWFRVSPYYQPWFALWNLIWRGYPLLGLPYIALTRAFNAAPDLDRKSAAYLVLKMLARAMPHRWLADPVVRHDMLGSGADSYFSTFTRADGNVLRALLVKMFFLPVMTVFFVDQFTHLMHNFRFLAEFLAKDPGPLDMSPLDFHNVSFSLIFSVDVGLAWSGYAISSRWIRNGIVSAEPTLLGWMVALLCYPPFQQVMSFLGQVPSESGFLSIPNPYVVPVFAGIAATSYLIYVSATVAFGLRFSNLTHRGIITTGPYAFVRHPAYAAKNLAWWAVMMPFVIYQSWAAGSALPLLQIAGLVALTGLYTLRALTEERHLSADPAYAEYCRAVPYRFIPRVL